MVNGDDYSLMDGSKESTMRKIAVSEFKAECLAVIDDVNKTKQSVIITWRVNRSQI
jgi:hypothetical protein